MCIPEELVSSLTNGGVSERKNDAHDDEQSDTRCAGECLKEPERDVRLIIRRKVHFSCETSQIFMRLR